MCWGEGVGGVVDLITFCRGLFGGERGGGRETANFRKIWREGLPRIEIKGKILVDFSHRFYRILATMQRYTIIRPGKTP